jgi:hypothetical protein
MIPSVPMRRYGARAAVLGALSTFLCGAGAWTMDESPRTVRMVGAHESPVGFVSLVEPLPATCAFGALYFDLSTPLGRALFATLTVAKTTGQKVRVGYTPPETTGNCWLQLAALV